MESKPISTSCD